MLGHAASVVLGPPRALEQRRQLGCTAGEGGVTGREEHLWEGQRSGKEEQGKRPRCLMRTNSGRTASLPADVAGPVRVPPSSCCCEVTGSFCR